MDSHLLLTLSEALVFAAKLHRQRRKEAVERIYRRLGW